MIKFIKSIFGFEKTKGPVVSGRKDGSDVECYIPFSQNSGDNPVIATEQFAIPRVGFDLSTTVSLNKINNANKLQLSMANQGFNNKVASMDLTATSQYLLIGGREYNEGSYRGIGFGYVGYPDQIAPIFVGMQETNEANNTLGDLVFATRPTTDISAPIVRLTIDSKGQIRSAVDYTPVNDADLATKYYVDNAVKGGGSSSSVTAKSVSCPAMSPSCTAVNVEDILIELNARIYDLEKRV